MSHYGINGSVPKTLIQYLIRWVADNDPAVADAREALESIAETTISPELVPRADGADEHDDPDQRSEDVVGPYELQDFHLYYTLRFGYRPSKIAFLAQHAWGDRERGQWPALSDPTKRNEYDLPTICHWLREFIARFFGTTPVQTLGAARRAQGRFRWVALTARRLARAERRDGRGLARRDRRAHRDAHAEP